MDYLKLYDNLINSRKILNRKKGAGEYFESHHVVPKWLGGVDSACNRVLLTAREHYIAHRCLWMHYRDRPSALAFHKMTKSSNNKQQRKFTSKQFEYARKAFSESQIGANNPMYGKESPNRGIPNPNKGKKLGPRPWLTGNNNPSKRAEVRQLISNALTGKTKTKEQIQKTQDSFRAAVKIICDHCSKKVDYRNFGRWHGNNCKLRGVH